MGLDIIIHKTNVLPEVNDIDEVFSEHVKTKFENFKKKFHEEFSRLLNVSVSEDFENDENYIKAYNTFVKNMKGWFGKFDQESLNEHIKSPKDIESIYNDYVKYNIVAEDLYYIKVNFLYAFFKEDPSFEVEECWVTKDKAQELVDKCKQILEDHSLASKLLPTINGFFFGSTDYNLYYFNNVKCVKDDFTDLLENWKDDERVFIYFSW